MEGVGGRLSQAVLRLYAFWQVKFQECIHDSYSAQSPFVTLLSRCAQSGRLSSFGKQVWFTESHTVLVIFFLLMFYLFILFLM